MTVKELILSTDFEKFYLGSDGDGEPDDCDDYGDGSALLMVDQYANKKVLKTEERTFKKCVNDDEHADFPNEEKYLFILVEE